MGPTPIRSPLDDSRSGGSGIVDDENGGGGSEGNNISESKEKQKNRRAKAKKSFDELGRYIIEDYDALPTFSSFLPVSFSGLFSVDFYH